MIEKDKEPLTPSENEELENLRKELADEKRKNKFAPKAAPIPEDQLGLPKGIQDGQIKTEVKDLSKVIKEKIDQIKDLATMEVMLDTHVRMRKRLETLRKTGSAEHMKIRGEWKTLPPQFYISGLEGKKINNDEYEISFGVYETDETGNKKLHTNYADVLLHDGSQIKRATSAEYRIAYEVVEKIKSGKPITREVFRLDRR